MLVKERSFLSSWVDRTLDERYQAKLSANLATSPNQNQVSVSKQQFVRYSLAISAACLPSI
jgi:hypothetical protein